MKKFFALMLVGATMSIVACGPSEEEKKKAEAEAAALADSLMKMANAGLEAAMADTTAAVEQAPATTTEEKK